MKSNQIPISVRYCGNASDGKRAYKITGTFSLSNINGGVVSGDAVFDNTTLYPNPYMTLTPEGYTKHYFAGAERIGTTQGGGNHGNWLVNPLDNLTQAEQVCLNDLSDGTIYQKNYYEYYDYPHHSSQTENTDYTGTVTSGDNTYHHYQYKEAETFLGELSICFKSMLSEHLEGYYLKDEVDEPFYYHSDHLGSAAWVTDGDGLPVQYIMYAPYGEELLNQHPWGYDERFKFTGKERDEETGYDYFGARYYLPIISIFGSVDPLANKYIYNSPYVYCEGNPIKYIDPDGLEKLIALAPDIARNQTLLKGANSFKDDAHVIHIWAHGTSEKIEFYIKGSSSMMEVSAGTTHNLAAYLSSNSELYAETEGHPAMIVLHSCETGKGENSIAQQISADENFANVLIVAPTENIAVDGNSNQELGAMKTQPNGDSNFPLFDENGNILYGAWKIFLNGEVVNSFSGSSSPNFSNPQEQLERYNNSENSSGI